MSIVFFCDDCGARFEVDSKMAGKKGRCKKCGHHIEIPAAKAKLPVAATPLAAAAAATSSSSWVAAVNSSDVGLKPLTIDRIPAMRRQPTKPTPLDDDEFEDSSPYNLATPKGERSRGRVTNQVNTVKRVWRNELSSVFKILRWVSETAYLISIPFLMLILFGIMLRSRHLAILGATVVVLLNVGRLGIGIVNLAVFAFREGIPQGVSFLIPPFTFIFLSKHWSKVHKSAKRVIEPAITIGLVVLAFTFIPSLSGGKKASGSVAERIREGASELEGDIRDEVSKSKKLDINSLGEKAKGELEDVKGRIRSKVEKGGDGSSQ